MRFLTAHWVLPMQGDPIKNGAVEIDGSVIKNVFTQEEFLRLNPPRQDVSDYGESIIAPGLINLHTHLEYSVLHLLDTEASLFDWIPKLMAQVKTWTPEQFVSSATLGAQQMVRFGTTCILDSSFSGYAAVGAARAGLRAIVGLEMFSVIDKDADLVWDRLNARKADLLRRLDSNELDGFGKTADAIAKGVILLSVAPHAPYTVGPALTAKAMRWAESNRVAWTMHIAESPQERRWIESADSHLDAYLQKVHTFPDGKIENIYWRGSGKSPVRHLADHDLLQPGLVAAHVVQVDDDDILLLAKHDVAVAHCPRSNARLRSGLAPVPKLLEAGVRVGFGTDSAASTDDLNVLAEARFSWHVHRAVQPSFPYSAEDAIRRLTVEAAKAIGMSDSIGTLERGKWADIAIFNISSACAVARERPYDVLLWGNHPVAAVFVGGEKVLENDLYL